MSCNPAQRARDQNDARTSLLQFFAIMGMSNETITYASQARTAANEEQGGCRTPCSTRAT